MKLCLATTNPHKLDEVRAIFDAHAPGAVTWLTLADVERERGAPLPEPEEDQPTFEGNATLKARAYAAATGYACLADDSGLEVDALGGRPGVRSARYSGVAGGRELVDPANNAKLLKDLAAAGADRDAERGARYVCAMTLAAPGENDVTVRGELPGRILRPEDAADPSRPAAGRGTGGFGYDPLVVLADGRTAAQYTPAEKNAVSHRGVATRALVDALRAAGRLPGRA